MLSTEIPAQYRKEEKNVVICKMISKIQDYLLMLLIDDSSPLFTEGTEERRWAPTIIGCASNCKWNTILYLINFLCPFQFSNDNLQKIYFPSLPIMSTS